MKFDEQYAQNMINRFQREIKLAINHLENVNKILVEDLKDFTYGAEAARMRKNSEFMIELLERQKKIMSQNKNHVLPKEK